MSKELNVRVRERLLIECRECGAKATVLFEGDNTGLCDSCFMDSEMPKEREVQIELKVPGPTTETCVECGKPDENNICLDCLQALTIELDLQEDDIEWEIE